MGIVTGAVVLLVIGAGAWRLDSTTRERPATSPELLRTISGHSSLVLTVAFSPRGSLLVNGSNDHTIRFWDPVAGRPRGVPLRGHRSAVTSVAFNHDGTILASVSRDGTLRLWDVTARRELGGPLTADQGYLTAVGFSPDGHLLATTGVDGAARLWDVDRWQAMPLPPPLHATLDPDEPHLKPVTSLAFSPRDPILATSGCDSTIWLWNTATGRLIGHALAVPYATPRGCVDAVAFSPDGQTVVGAGDDRQVHRWNVATQGPIGVAGSGHHAPVAGVAVARDGRIATAGWDSTARVWDASGGGLTGHSLVGHENVVNAVAFSPDGAIATGSDDETVLTPVAAVVTGVGRGRMSSTVRGTVARSCTQTSSAIRLRLPPCPVARPDRAFFAVVSRRASCRTTTPLPSAVITSASSGPAGDGTLARSA